jgi:hypothetical protein
MMCSFKFLCANPTDLNMEFCLRRRGHCWFCRFKHGIQYYLYCIQRLCNFRPDYPYVLVICLFYVCICSRRINAAGSHHGVPYAPRWNEASLPAAFPHNCHVYRLCIPFLWGLTSWRSCIPNRKGTGNLFHYHTGFFRSSSRDRSCYTKSYPRVTVIFLRKFERGNTAKYVIFCITTKDCLVSWNEIFYYYCFCLGQAIFCPIMIQKLRYLAMIKVAKQYIFSFISRIKIRQKNHCDLYILLLCCHLEIIFILYLLRIRTPPLSDSTYYLSHLISLLGERKGWMDG